MILFWSGDSAGEVLASQGLVCSFESAKPEEWGMVKTQKSYITMSLYAIKALQKLELKSPNENLFTGSIWDTDIVPLCPNLAHTIS